MDISLILRGLTGELSGQEHAFPGPTQVILGRSHCCTLRLPGDATVSRRHCLIELDGHGAWVQELGSLNGTFLNGEMIGQGGNAGGGSTWIQPPRHALRDGDELRIGNSRFAVGLTEGEPGSREAVASDNASGERQLALSL